MMGGQARTVGLLLAAVVIFGTGIWLTRSGRPYGTGLLTVHKLVDLGAVIVIGIAVYQASGASALSPMLWAVIGATAISVAAAFATGGVVSANSAAPAWVARLHAVAAWLAGILSAASVYLLARG